MEEISVLIEKSQAGDKEAREVLIENNLGLVHHIVKRFAGRGYDTEDLFQIGTIGLIKAIDKFDLSFDVRFSTYAVPMIMGEIKRFLRDDGMLKVSRTLKENGLKVKLASERLTGLLGREPQLSEVAEEAGLTAEEMSSLRTTDDSDCYLKITFTLDDGQKDPQKANLVYRFYRISERRCYMTVETLATPDAPSSPENGQGMFCVLRSFCDKLAADVTRLYDRIQVYPDSKN